MSAPNANEPVHMLPIRLKSIVCRGFGRGSSELGIPTANLDSNNLSALSVPQKSAPTFQDLPTGIYWGYARIGSDKVYTAAISMGYNPTYNNEQKTIEPHLIAQENDPRRHASSCGETVLQDFYDQPIRLSLCGYLRPELPFEGLDKLTQAIKKDIENAVALASDQTSDLAKSEKEWTESSRD